MEVNSLMSVIVPVWTYGQIRDYGGNPQAGATVNASGSTGAAADSYQSATTDSNGNYQMNIQDYVNDGDTVKVIATYAGLSNSDTYSLTLGDLPEQINLQLSAPGGDSESYTYLYKRAGQNKRFVINHVPGKMIRIIN